MLKLMKANIKRVLLVAALLLLVWFLYRGVLFLRGGSDSGVEGGVFAVKIEAVPVRIDSIPMRVRAFGSLVAVDAGDISSELAGQIDEILFVEGQTVEKGTPLIRLDSAIYEANLQAAKAEATFSEVNYERTAELVKRGAQSQENLDIASAELESRRADVAVKQAELDKMTLVAPYDGRLGARRISVGDYVAPGDPLVYIVDHKTLKIDYSVPERYLKRLATGQLVELTTSAFPRRMFMGSVDYIAPAVSEATRSIAIRALVPNEDEILSPGLSVQVTHILGVVERAMVLPEEALVATLEGQVVYRVVDDQAVATRVNVGSRSEGMVEIVDGLEEDDVVIVGGQQKIRDGSLVEIVETESPDTLSIE